MARSRTTVEVIPSAKRLIHSLRDIGYDFKHAVADIVDNSIAAKASQVAIDMRFDGEDSWLRIADNGTGMSGTTITEAMRFGSEREYEADELGKFGLGLKTASLSQCLQFTVASRMDKNTRRIEVRQWDLGHVESTNRWEIIDVPASERPDELIEPLENSTGTVVLWEQLDRVLGYKIPWGDRARNGFFRLAEELDLHLGMVFHRFLSGEARRRKRLKIAINGTAVEAWDPFARSEKATISLPNQEFEITSDEGPGLVAYRPYILPPRERFSTQKEFDRLAGPGKWNYQQGFYIYRADRMIQSGGWSHMRTSDEHTKLARVALEFMPDLDSAFDLNVSKARVNLPAKLKQELKLPIEHLAKQARKAYTPSSVLGTGGPSRTSKTPRFPGSSGPTSSVDANMIQPPINDTATPAQDGDLSRYRMNGSRGLQSHPNVNASVGKAIERAAEKAGEIKALNRIREALKDQEPQTATEIGW
jgi:hypothetical protein